MKTDVRLPYLLRLFNSDGKLVLQKELRGDGSVRMDGLSKGAYLYEIISDQGRSRGKLVVD